MPKTNIAFFELEKWEEKYIEENLGKTKNINISFFPKPLNKNIIDKITDIDVLAVFIYSSVNKEIIYALPKLKYITTMSTGFDHIDLNSSKEKNIKVSNVPYYGENTVAEHTFSLILAISRKMCESAQRVNELDFNPAGLMGFDLKGKTIGLVGLGHIGAHVARIARGFEMNVFAFDPKKDKGLARDLKIKYVNLKTLLKNSDIISLHAPYNKNTHHLINMKNINDIKKGAYLINTARGGLVETDALIKALNKKIIAGAGLDVLEEEKFIKEEKQLLSKSFEKENNLRTVLQGHYLIKDPRVLVTPHNAFNSEEALKRILDTTIENINGFLKKKPTNLVK